MQLQHLLLTLILFSAPGFAATISGTVFDQGTLEPIAQASVALEKQVLFSWNPVDSTTAGGDGSYQFRVSTAGNYRVVGSQPSYLPGILQLAVNPNLNYPGSDLFLSEPGSMSLEVRDQATNLPLADVPVRLVGPSFVVALTDANGVVSFSDVAQGQYWLCAIDHLDEFRNQCYPDQLLPLGDDLSTATPLDIASGESLLLNMSLVAGASLSGILTDAYTGQPIAQQNASFALFAVDGQLIYNSTIATETDGAYRVPGLPELGFHLVFGDFQESGSNYHWNAELYPDLPCIGNCQVSAGDLLQTSTTTPLTGIDFSLFPGAIAQGVVNDQTTGLPLAGVPVQAYEPFLLGGWVPIRSGLSDATGAYEIAGIRPQQNLRIAALSEAGYIREAWQDLPCFGRCENGDSFTLAPEQVQENLDFDLVPGFGIAGRSFEFGSGLGVPARISLVDLGGQLLYEIVTDGDGNYQVPPVPNGTYLAYAQVFDAQGLRQCQVYMGMSCGAPNGPINLTEAKPIVVTEAGDTVGIDFDLISYVFVSGFE